MQRLKALEIVRRVKCGMPLLMVVNDGGITDDQKIQIDSAKNEGREVVMIVRDKN